MKRKEINFFGFKAFSYQMENGQDIVLYFNLNDDGTVKAKAVTDPNGFDSLEKAEADSAYSVRELLNGHILPKGKEVVPLDEITIGDLDRGHLYKSEDRFQHAVAALEKAIEHAQTQEAVDIYEGKGMRVISIFDYFGARPA